VDVGKEKVFITGFNNNLLAGEYYCSQTVAPTLGIVCCHGLCSSSNEFGDFPLRLAERGFACLVFDYSGHGQSQGIKNLFTKESHEADTDAAITYMASRGIKAIGVFGHSFGVYAALSAGLRNSAVRFLVLYAPQMRSGGSLAFHKKIGFFLLGMLYKYCGKVLPDTNIPYSGKTIPIRFLGYAIDADNAAIARKLQKPVLVGAGEEDTDVAVRTVEALYKLIASQKELIVLRNGGHNPFSGDCQDSLLDAIVGFTRRIG